MRRGGVEGRESAGARVRHPRSLRNPSVRFHSVIRAVERGMCINADYYYYTTNFSRDAAFNRIISNNTALIITETDKDRD